MRWNTVGGPGTWLEDSASSGTRGGGGVSKRGTGDDLLPSSDSGEVSKAPSNEANCSACKQELAQAGVLAVLLAILCTCCMRLELILISRIELILISTSRGGSASPVERC